jgi:hypothetical protein
LNDFICLARDTVFMTQKNIDQSLDLQLEIPRDSSGGIDLQSKLPTWERVRQISAGVAQLVFVHSDWPTDMSMRGALECHELPILYKQIPDDLYDWGIPLLSLTVGQGAHDHVSVCKYREMRHLLWDLFPHISEAFQDKKRI